MQIQGFSLGVPELAKEHISRNQRISFFSFPFKNSTLLIVSTYNYHAFKLQLYRVYFILYQNFIYSVSLRYFSVKMLVLVDRNVGKIIF